MTTQQEDLDHSTHLAFERTRMAQERTLLGWIRTAITTISFGFTIFTVFAIEKGAGYQFVGYYAPRIFSLGLVIIGLVSLLFATLQRRRDLATLRSIDPALPARSQAMVLGFLMAILGIVALSRNSPPDRPERGVLRAVLKKHTHNR